MQEAARGRSIVGGRCRLLHLRDDVGRNANLLYRVLWLERATLRFSKAGERWRIAELRCHRNQEPSPETFEFVKTWLDQTQEMVEMGSPQLVDDKIDPDLCPF